MKEIPGFPLIYATEDGKIFSMLRGSLVELVGPSLDSGYKRVTLFRKQYFVHRLILLTFGGACPEGMEALHADGCRTNNHISNLRWGTRTENVADTRRHGRDTFGERHGGAKLSNVEVVEIKQKLSEGYAGCVLAQQYGVSAATISMIKHGNRRRRA